jgi:hypothetical protein
VEFACERNSSRSEIVASGQKSRQPLDVDRPGERPSANRGDRLTTSERKIVFTPWFSREDAGNDPSFLTFSPFLKLRLADCFASHHDGWMTRHGFPLGPAGLGHHWEQAAQVFEESAYAASWKYAYRESTARKIYARILMDSAPLSPEELRKAAERSCAEAQLARGHCSP